MEKKLIKPGFFAKEASADSRRVEFDILNEQYLHCKKKADVVFFGDSITHFWDLELYFNPAILKINRGIGGDNTVHAAMRFEADVLQIDADIIIILLGINDLLKIAPDLWWRTNGANKDEIINNITESFKSMLSRSAEKDVYVCSILPQSMCPPYDKEMFKKLIINTNNILKTLCEEYNATYIDYYSAIEENDLLPDDLSHDGIHPNGKCYEIMADILKKKIGIL